MVIIKTTKEIDVVNYFTNLIIINMSNTYSNFNFFIYTYRYFMKTAHFQRFFYDNWLSLIGYCAFCVSFKLWKCIEQHFFFKTFKTFEKKVYSKLKRKQLNVLNKYDRIKGFYRFRIYYYLQYINKIITQGLSPIQTIDIVNYL